MRVILFVVLLSVFAFAWGTSNNACHMACVNWIVAHKGKGKPPCDCSKFHLLSDEAAVFRKSRKSPKALQDDSVLCQSACWAWINIYKSNCSSNFFPSKCPLCSSKCKK